MRTSVARIVTSEHICCPLCDFKTKPGLLITRHRGDEERALEAHVKAKHRKFKVVVDRTQDGKVFRVLVMEKTEMDR